MDTKKLRQKILDLAIHGRLVPQDPADEPASVLLDRIREEKQRLIKEGKIRPSKKAKAATPDKRHYPYELPKGWCWTTLGEICRVVTGTTPPKDNMEFYDGQIPFYKPTDLEQGGNTVYSNDHLSHKGFEAARQLPANSILVTCVGATIGKAGVIRVEGACNQQINAVLPNDFVQTDYLYKYFMSAFTQQNIKDSASATTLPILNKTNFERLPLPLPPIIEQHRIVAEVERIFGALDAMSENLR